MHYHDYFQDEATYNFEVANTHTYVAGGIRVHNDSVLTYSDPDTGAITEVIVNDDGVPIEYHAVRHTDDGDIDRTVVTSSATNRGNTDRVVRERSLIDKRTGKDHFRLRSIEAKKKDVIKKLHQQLFGPDRKLDFNTHATASSKPDSEKTVPELLRERLEIIRQKGEFARATLEREGLLPTGFDEEPFSKANSAFAAASKPASFNKKSNDPNQDPMQMMFDDHAYDPLDPFAPLTPQGYDIPDFDGFSPLPEPSPLKTSSKAAKSGNQSDPSDFDSEDEYLISLMSPEEQAELKALQKRIEYNNPFGEHMQKMQARIDAFNAQQRQDAMRASQPRNINVTVTHAYEPPPPAPVTRNHPDTLLASRSNLPC